MKQIPLFYAPANKRYYYVGIPVCELCGRQEDKRIIIKSSWDKKESYLRLFCLNCFNKDKKVSTVQEIRGAKVVLSRPKNTILVLNRPPSLVDGRNETVFSIAEKNVSCETVVDHTRLAGRESIEGAQIGLSPGKVDSKNKVLSNDEADKLLLSYKDDDGQVSN